MNIERLTRLADYMETVPPKKLDMDAWLTNSDGESYESRQAAYQTVAKGVSLLSQNDYGEKCYTILPEGYCGTAACVLGHATFVPEFREAGLRNEITIGEDCEEEVLAGRIYDIGAEIVFNGAEGFAAGAEFFDISWNDASVLFGTRATSRQAYGAFNPTPQEVAKGIRRYIAEGAFWNKENV